MKSFWAIISSAIFLLLSLPALADTLDRYGIDLLPGQYCSTHHRDTIGIAIEDKAEDDFTSPDVTIEYKGKSYPGQTAYSYFGSLVAPPENFVLGILPMTSGLDNDGILVFKKENDHWLTYQNEIYEKC